jgi:hypothetical protein
MTQADRLRYLQPVADLLAPMIDAAPATLVGCNSFQIQALEGLVAPYRLPASYVEFLRFGGIKLGRLFNLVNLSYAQAWLIRSHPLEIVRLLRRLDKGALLPDTVFVVNEHLASNFTYFELDAGDDPPVYLWEEGEGGLETAIREHDSFSAFLLATATVSIELWRRR